MQTEYDSRNKIILNSYGPSLFNINFSKSTLVCLSAPHLPINHDDAFTNKIDNS